MSFVAVMRLGLQYGIGNTYFYGCGWLFDELLLSLLYLLFSFVYLFCRVEGIRVGDSFIEEGVGCYEIETIGIEMGWKGIRMMICAIVRLLQY